MKLLQERFANLLCIKSIVTIVVTLVFAYLAVFGKIDSQLVMNIVTMVFSFYFGTQHEKKTASKSEDTTKN